MLKQLSEDGRDGETASREAEQVFWPTATVYDTSHKIRQIEEGYSNCAFHPYKL